MAKRKGGANFNLMSKEKKSRHMGQQKKIVHGDLLSFILLVRHSVINY
jgi:hypothetical protein